MMESLRFRGLAVEAGRESPLRSGNLPDAALKDPERSRCILWREGFSILARAGELNARAKLAKLIFS